MVKMVRVELDHWPFIKYVRYDELVSELRGELLEQAIAQMKATGQNYAYVKCPCCGRLIKITIEEMTE